MTGRTRSALAVCVVVATSMVLAVGCNREGEGEGNPRRSEYEQDSPTTGQLPPSTGVPDESTTSSVPPNDGGTEGGDRTDTSIAGAQPGRPQLDGEPGRDPSG